VELFRELGSDDVVSSGGADEHAAVAAGVVEPAPGAFKPAEPDAPSAGVAERTILDTSDLEDLVDRNPFPSDRQDDAEPHVEFVVGYAGSQIQPVQYENEYDCVGDCNGPE